MPDVDVRSLTGPLVRLRARTRALLMAHQSLVLVAWVVGVLVGLGLVDYLLRLPRGLRTVHLVVGLGVLGFAAWRRFMPAFRYRPDLTDLALRVEDAHPPLRGNLASAIDFSSAHNKEHYTAVRNAMAEKSVREVVKTWRSENAAGLIRKDRTLRVGVILSVIVACAVGLFAMNRSLAAIGVTRALVPWSSASWPKRTQVEDAMGTRVHPLGESLAMQAVLVKSRRAPDETDVSVRYRLVKDGRVGASKVELLNHQGGGIVMSILFEDGESVEANGELFERLIEPTGDAVEYRFETEDDETSWRRIELVEPPAVVGASATITPPAYVGDLMVETSPDSQREGAPSPTGLTASQREVDLGPGTDERAIVQSSLEGSRVALTLVLNKAALIDPAFETALRTVDPDAHITQDGETFYATFTLSRSLRLPVRLTDEHEIASVDEPAYRFDAMPDRAPAATVTRPLSDRTVLATATVEVIGEGRDDVGLAWTALERTVYKPAGRAGSEPSGPGGAMEAQGEPTEMARTTERGKRVLAVTTTLDLSVLGLRPGDEVHVAALAADMFVKDGVSREAARSSRRVLRVIDEATFIEEIRDRLSEIRQSAIRIENQQDEVRARTSDTGVDRAARRGQAQVNERLARQGKELAEAIERVDENGLNDPAMRDVLNEAKDLLNQAGNAASQASRTMDNASARQADQPNEAAEMTQDESREVDDAQRDVQDRLAELIDTLDRGEDIWTVRNAIDRLIGEQAALREDTVALGKKTAGRTPGELSAEEKSELERIVEKQFDLAKKTEELIDDMNDRKDQLEEEDPDTAQGLSDAASRAQQSQVAETMKEAARNADQNQTSSAQKRQQEAQESLEEMRKDLDNAEKSRDESLRRALRSVVESLEGLIEQQTRELTALDDAERTTRGFSDLDDGMIALNQNTLGVLDVIQGGDARLAPVGSLVERASDAQIASIETIRFDVEAGAEAVRAHEKRSLAALEEAKDKAEALEQEMADRELERKKKELEAAYRAIMEQQAALLAETTVYAAKAKLNRRDRISLRRQSEPQRDVGEALEQMEKDVPELLEARVFAYAHKRLDRLIEDAGEALESADANKAQRRQRAILSTLGMLLEALKDPDPDDNPFGEDQQSGGGQGQQGGEQPLLPPAKQLMLLRGLQEDVAMRTIESEDEASSGDIIELGKEQRDIFDLANGLIEDMQGGGDPTKIVPGLEVGEGDDDDTNDDSGNDADEGDSKEESGSKDEQN